MRKLFALFATLTLFFTASLTHESPGTRVNAQGNGKAEKLIRKASGKIHNSYIIVFEDWAAGTRGKFSQAGEMAEFMRSIYGGRIKHVYKDALNGFAAEM